MSKKLAGNEDPHHVQLNTVDIWVQVYDLPNGMYSEKILQDIGNYIGSFVMVDGSNNSSAWRLYTRIRVTMDVNKPLKRHMKIKKEGGTGVG